MTIESQVLILLLTLVFSLSTLSAYDALQILSMDYTGLAFMLLGLLLLMAEILAPTFGILGIVGVVAFMFGYLLLIGAIHGVIGLSPLTETIIVILSVVTILIVVSLALRAQRRPVMGGGEELFGEQGIAIEDWSTTEGTVRVHGELWSARAAIPLRRGQALRIVGRDGMYLLLSSEINEAKSS